MYPLSSQASQARSVREYCSRTSRRAKVEIPDHRGPVDRWLLDTASKLAHLEKASTQADKLCPFFPAQAAPCRYRIVSRFRRMELECPAPVLSLIGLRY